MFLWFPTHSFGPQREVPAVSWPAKPQNVIWFSLFFTYVFHSLLSLGPIPPTNCWSWHQRNSWHRWWRSLHPPGHLSTAISPSIHDVSSVRYSVGPSPLGIAKECFSRQRILIFKIQKSARKQKLEQALSPNKLEQFRLPSIASWLRFHAHMWPKYTLCRNVYKACWQTWLSLQVGKLRSCLEQRWFQRRCALHPSRAEAFQRLPAVDMNHLNHWSSLESSLAT